MLLSSLMGGISFPRTILICKARRYFLQGVHQGDIKSNTRSGRILRLVRIYQSTSMKDHRKTLLSSPSSKDSHSNIAKNQYLPNTDHLSSAGSGRNGRSGNSRNCRRTDNRMLRYHFIGSRVLVVSRLFIMGR